MYHQVWKQSEKNTSIKQLVMTLPYFLHDEPINYDQIDYIYTIISISLTLFTFLLGMWILSHVRDHVRDPSKSFQSLLANLLYISSLIFNNAMYKQDRRWNADKPSATLDP